MVRDLTGKHPQYYEGTLQLRNVTQEMVDYVRDEVYRMGMRIAKETPVNDGLDIQLTDKALMRTLGKNLQSKYGGEYKESATIFTQIDGKDVYRLTILFRGMKGIKKGDKIVYRGEEYEIKLISSKDVMLQEINSGKKIHVKYDEIKNFKKKE